jgi:hypothetical protein
MRGVLGEVKAFIHDEDDDLAGHETPVEITDSYKSGECEIAFDVRGLVRKPVRIYLQVDLGVLVSRAIALRGGGEEG